MGELACLFSALAWAIASAVYKTASRSTSPYQVNLFRCAAAVGFGLLSSAVFGNLDGITGFSGEAWGLAALSGVAARGLGDSFFLFSAGRIGLARTMPFSALYPVWATLLARLIRGEATPLRGWLGMGMALAGVLLVMRSGWTGAGKGSRSNDLWGYGLALSASLAWSVSVVCVKWGAEGLDPVLFNVARMAAGGLALAIFLSLRRESLFPRVSRPGALFGAAALESWLGSAAYVYGLAHTSTAAGATLSSLAPVMSIPVAAFFLKEKMSPGLIAGILLATLGVIGLINP